MHGGKTPRGIASANFKTGRYSKDLPTRMASRYREAQEDSDLLVLRDDIALVDTRITDLLSRVDTGEAGVLWKTLKKAYDDYRAATIKKDALAMADALQTIEASIKQGNADYVTWSEVIDLVDRRRRLVESERKRLVEMQQTITTERAMALLGAVVDTIRKHVADRDTLVAISNDIGKLVVIEGVEATTS